jgi:exodeoxyribonuclease VIII
MPNDLTSYNENPALNCSGAKIILQSPLHYQQWLKEPHEDTPALKIGRLVHLASLEPQRYSKEVLTAPECDRRTKIGKELWENFIGALKPDQIAITQSESELITNVAASARTGLAKISQSMGDPEWIVETPVYNKFNGISIKGRPDLVLGDVVVDVKTTLDAGSKSFSRDCVNFKYHMQAAWYLHLVGAKRFLFVVVEKNPPYDWTIYELDEQAIAEGAKLMASACALYGECNLYKVFPGYSKNIQTLSLPKWGITLDI